MKVAGESPRKIKARGLEEWRGSRQSPPSGVGGGVEGEAWARVVVEGQGRQTDEVEVKNPKAVAAREGKGPMTKVGRGRAGSEGRRESQSARVRR